MSDPAELYVCAEGHVEEAPSMGTYGSCQVLKPLAGKPSGQYRCGSPSVRVAMDPVLMDAWRTGGAEAVMAVVLDRRAAAR